MAYTLLTPHLPQQIDFYLPDHDGLSYQGDNLHLVLLLESPDNQPVLAGDVYEAWLGVGQETYRYAILFPDTTWKGLAGQLMENEKRALQRLLVFKLANRHGVDLHYFGPCRDPHYTEGHVITHCLPVFDQYYEVNTYIDWMCQRCVVGDVALLQFTKFHQV